MTNAHKLCIILEEAFDYPEVYAAKLALWAETVDAENDLTVFSPQPKDIDALEAAQNIINRLEVTL